MNQETSDPARGPAAFVPLAIIGMGCLFPKADNLEAYWANIRDRVDCITDIPPTHWNPVDYYDADKKAPDKVYARRGGFLDHTRISPMEFGIAPRDIEATDTTQLLGLLAAKQALIDAGYGPDREFDRENTSVILGVTGALEMVVPLGARLGHPIWRKALEEAGVDSRTAEDVVKRISGSYVEWQENSFPGLLGNVTAGRIANRFDLGGTNCVVDAACASSLSALHLAAMELSSGRANMVVTGGADTFSSIFMYTCFSKTPALSPSGEARPFDAEGDGTTLGEGLGVLVLKRLDDAEKDGDRIYAVVRGIGSSSDGKGNAVYAPNSKGQSRAIRRAYAQAGIGPETIELVEAHGTGTVVGDGIELNALLDVYDGCERQAPWCALGSVKSQIGHTKAAAGAAGLIKAALALKYKTLPPTIKVKKPLKPLVEKETPLYLNTRPRPWLSSGDHPRRAALSSFGFGGSNFHVVLEEYGKEKTDIDWDGRVLIVAFSGKDPRDLMEKVKRMPDPEDRPVFRAFASESRGSYRSDEPNRLLMVFETGVTDVGRLKETVLKRLESGDEEWALPDGAYFGSGAKPGKLALLFPGQGSQYVGMLRDIACRFPEMFHLLAAANHTFAGQEGESPTGRLCDLIYPVRDFTEEDRKAAEAALKDTRVAQPAIGAVALGLYRVLEFFGLQGDLAAGHSYGELVALCVSGRYGDGELHRLSRLRGSLMAGTNGRQGSMLAVRAGAGRAAELIERYNLKDLVVANKNAPEQTVISGGLEDIDKAARVFKEAGIHSTRLKVAKAFHSHLMAPAKGAFRDALGEVRFTSAKIPVYANSTAGPYPDDEPESREILAGQLVRPVEFIDQIVNMHEAGVGTFLEIGPGNTLTGLVGAILRGKRFHALAVDASKGARSGMVDLARTLAQLSALGYALDLGNWDGAYGETDKAPASTGFTVPVCGANSFEKKEIPPAPKPDRTLTAESRNRISNRTIEKTKKDGNQPVSSMDGSVLKPIVKTEKMKATSPDPVKAGVLQEALRLTRENMDALQRMQTQTAELHRQFLAGQEIAQRNLTDLIQQQRHLLEKAVGDSTAGAFPQASADQPCAGVPEVRLTPENPIETQSVPIEPATAATPVDQPTIPDGGIVLKLLIEVVSANTGYPEEMLSPDMSLDEDLGIDSIKRVEILSALSERLPDLPPVTTDEIGGLRTLGDVADFLVRQSGGEARGEIDPQTSPAVNNQAVAEILLKVVSEQTGYPPEMLELSMNLDTDLGIDSIKRVEIMSALSDVMPGLPVVESDQLGRLQTLQEVVDFLISGTETTAPSVSEEATPDSSVWEGICRAVEELTGYPRENLDPDQRLDEGLGIDPVRLVELLQTVGSILEIDPGKPHFAGTETLGAMARFFSDLKKIQFGASSQDDIKNVEEALERYVVEARLLNDDDNRGSPDLPKGARIWVTADAGGLSDPIARALEDKGFNVEIIGRNAWEDKAMQTDLSGLIIVSGGVDADDDFLHAAFKLAKRAAPVLRAQSDGGTSVFATISRLDGRFGFSGEEREFNPKSGGLAGLAKTAHHEWAEVNATAFDVDVMESDLFAAARDVVDELFINGPQEVGISGGRKWTTCIRPERLESADDAFRLDTGDVVLVSGGARGVTAEAALAMAKKWRPTLVLLGRTPPAEVEPEWLAGLTDKASIKKALFENSPADASPKDVERSYRRIMSTREVQGNLARIREAGSKAIYMQVDVTDTMSVGQAVSDIRTEYGPVRGLVHGAGLLADRLIEDKTPEQFASVFAVKATGLSALLNAVGDDPLRFMVLFSSSTGRFGRRGQVDYAVANEFLNKTAQREAARRPECRVVSFNWGPWAGGMVNPALERIFKKEGLALIPLEAGAEYMVREIVQGRSGPVEIVVLGSGSQLPDDVMSSESDNSNGKTVIERSLSIDRIPILKSHVLGGRAVLPMAMMIEWMAQAVFENGKAAGFIGFDRLDVHKRLALNSGDHISLKLTAEPSVPGGNGLSRKVSLRSADGREADIYSEFEAALADGIDLGRPVLEDGRTGSYPHNGKIYEQGRLFHGPDLRGVVHIEGCDATGISGRIKTSEQAPSFFSSSDESPRLTDPLTLDSVFQMVILWCWEHHGLPALPIRIGRYRQRVDGYPPADEVRAIVRIKEDKGPMIKADIEIADLEGRLISRFDDVVCFESEKLIEEYRQNRLQGEPVPAGLSAAGASTDMPGADPVNQNLWPTDR